jgi:hypothetical protein
MAILPSAQLMATNAVLFILASALGQATVGKKDLANQRGLLDSQFPS